MSYNVQVGRFFVEPGFEVVQVEVDNDDDDGKGGHSKRNLFDLKVSYVTLTNLNGVKICRNHAFPDRYRDYQGFGQA